MLKGKTQMYPSQSEVDVRKECQRTLVQVVKMHINVRRVPRGENSSRLYFNNVVLGQHNVVLILIWYALQRATRLM